MLSAMCYGNLLEAYGHGRGTKYHIQGVNVALLQTLMLLLQTPMLLLLKHMKQ